MIDALITSKTRIKLLLRFFLNSNNNAYLRELASDFNESTNSIRLELNRFEKAGLLHSNNQSNKKLYTANTKHPLFKDIHNILLKYVGLDQIIDKIIVKLGKLNKVFILGDFAKGLDSKIIDLLFIGDEIDKEYLVRLTGKVEKIIKRSIHFSIMSNTEAQKHGFNSINDKYHLLLWQAE